MKLYRSDEGFINYQIKNTFIYKYRLFGWGDCGVRSLF